MDAAHLPQLLIDRMIHEGGFHFDDFPHQLEVNGERKEARHLTKYLYAPISSSQAKEECLKLKNWAQEFNFQGLIQCEFVMEESEWHQKKESSKKITPPFQLINRSLSSNKGDQFKKHEIHLEVDKTFSSPTVIQALKQTGLHILENEKTITFTTSGHSKIMLEVRERLKDFLKNHGEDFKAKLIYEATAFYSLHEVESKTLPTIVDRVIVH